jgi:hypothetical protein
MITEALELPKARNNLVIFTCMKSLISLTNTPLNPIMHESKTKYHITPQKTSPNPFDQSSFYQHRYG